MDKEAIFDLDIERIQQENLKNIVLKASSIRTDNYMKLAEILENSPQLERLSINVKDGNDKFWNNFFKVLMPQDGIFSIDPSKIELTVDIEKFNCDIYKYIENLKIKSNDIGKFKQIEEKFPNLKKITLVEPCISIEDIINNSNTIFDMTKYMRCMSFAASVDVNTIRDSLKMRGIDENYIISDDGLCIINKEILYEKDDEPTNLRINASDIEKIDIEKLKETKDKITLIINNVSELSNTMIQKYQSAGLDIQGITVYSPENNWRQNETYDVQTYTIIRDKLEELVEGIDLNLPEKERFAEVYKRVCSNIVYDRPAAYPKTKEQEVYSKQQDANCRNLKNGLIEGKCVCAGYADILKNALAMVDIESIYIEGPVIDKKISETDFNEEKYRGSYYEKKEDGTVEIGEYHAWNKVKLDGKWYNVDSTWDATEVRLGGAPTNCLKTDEEIRNIDKKVKFGGPECNTSIDSKEIEKMFGIKHLYLGKTKIPNTKDIIKGIRFVGETYVEMGKEIKKAVINIKDFLIEKLKKDKTLKLNSPENESLPNQLESNAWDLNNWGVDSNEFRRETKNISKKVNKNYSKQTDKKEFEKEK